MRPLLLTLPLLWGCDLNDTGDDTEELIDVGQACLTAGGSHGPWSEGAGETQLLDEAAAVVTVVLTDCESGSIRFEDLSCTAEADGATLTVTSSALRTTLGGDVTRDCNHISVECQTPALGEGSWTLAYGDGSVAFEIPYSGAAPCASGADYPSVF